jgi:hypothetical protein
MKQTLGFGIVLAVAVAAMRLGGGSSATGPQQTGSGGRIVGAKPTNPAPSANTTYHGGCTAFDPDTAKAGYPRDSSRGAAKSVLDKFFNIDPNVDTSAKLSGYKTVHYAITLAPDPRHTNLSLVFDRQAVIIQQAAQDEGYTYDSSWLPWQTDPSYPLLENQQFADDLTDDREACPGVLLFRKSVNSQTAHAFDAYAEALVVLVVGEQPTGGLNEDQWANSILWLNANASATELHQNNDLDEADRPRTLRVLGPSFSGSLVSLERELSTISSAVGAFPNVDSPIRLLSGVIGSCSSIRWFQQRLLDKHLDGKILFGSFSENDELRIYRFLSYLRDQGTRAADTAIVSEDETAYALPNGDAEEAKAEEAKAEDHCNFPYDLSDRPVRLFYPRDISSLRGAYEKQSIFSVPNQAASSAHPILHWNGAGEAGEPASASDTIPAYSGEMTAVAQEAILYGIVSNLRVHHTRYLILRCTNPLDYLFLIRFFHRAYPEGRVVTVGADLLFRREIDTTEFRGVFALSNYPLLPRNQHWSSLSERGRPATIHAHRIFESNYEGSYIAARYLFGDQDKLKPQGPAPPPTPFQLTGPPSINFKENIPEFADPFWMHTASESLKSAKAPTWLAVVGRDGYWPIAVLNGDSTPNVDLYGIEEKQPNLPPSTMVQVLTNGVYYELSNDGPYFSKSLLFSLPLPWKICTVCAVLLLLYQGFGLWRGYKLTSSGLFVLFRRVSAPSQAILLGVNCGLATAILLNLSSIGFTLPTLGDQFGGTQALGIFCFLCFIAVFILLLLFDDANSEMAVMSFVLTALMVAFASHCAFGAHLNVANDVPFFYRMEHVTSGVSPLVPVLFLLGGFYLWTWQALAGNSLLCSGRPILPGLERTRAVTSNRHWKYWSAHWYYTLLGISTSPRNSINSNGLDESQFRISEELGRRIVKIANPLCVDPEVIGLPACLALGAITLFGSDLPLLGMESQAYARCINLALLFAFVLTTAETARLYLTWVELRRMLTALNRLRLRRTFAKLRAVDSNSLWSVSGNVQRVQYLFFSQQLDAATRLSNLATGRRQSVLNAVASGTRFASVCARKLNIGPRWEDEVRRSKKPVWPITDTHLRSEDCVRVFVRDDLNDAVADVLNSILIPIWNTERKSLSLENSSTGDKEENSERNVFDMKLSGDILVRTAEEFVCFHYIAFIQNILARMRTMTLSMISLFVSVCLAISFYPFVPRTQIGLWMVANLLLIAAAVVYVYAGMERDETLSYITNTHPGRLSTEFYLKTAGFLAAPILGLLTAQFPAIPESILGWVQPGLDAIK